MYVVCVVYEDVLYGDCYLLYVLFFDLLFEVVDVNVYLLKIEVCFCDLCLIY